MRSFIDIFILLFYRRLASSYVPRRAILYAPGNDARKLQKAASLDVDCIVMDCEDGVAINRKVVN